MYMNPIRTLKQYELVYNTNKAIILHSLCILSVCIYMCIYIYHSIYCVVNVTEQTYVS